ncbi:MAG TPA: DUF6228 family protein [Steroidobacteraceae bacterium]|nr:DUF6228 family protein [Steroidobacteraceae bacterium]
MRTFELKGEEATLRLSGEPPAIAAPHFGWEYRAELQGHALQVTLAVGDDDPTSFVEFFESLAEDWQGWPEARGYESLDGTLRIAATHDRVRAVRFEIRLRGDARSGFDWAASHRLSVESGHLGKLAAAARAFAV